MSRGLAGHVDKPLLVTVAALALLGLYNLSSAGQPLGIELYVSQATYMAIGCALMIVVASVDYRGFEGLAIPVFLIVVALLGLTDVAGRVVNGSRRWLPLGPVNLETSDLAKLAVILIVARMLHGHKAETSGGLTLREIFRPLNVSRPLVIVGAVLVLTLIGDGVKPAELKRPSGERWRMVAKLTKSHARVTIGRALDSDVQIRQNDVEERHAVVSRRSDGWYVLRDLGGDAGSYVNGERVPPGGERRIHDGDTLRFGLNVRSELHLSAPVEKLQPRLRWVAILGTIWLFVSMFWELGRMRRGQASARDLIAPIDVVALPAVLILVEPDLGTTLVVVLVALTMMLYVGIEPLSLLLLLGGGIAGSAVAWRFLLKPYQKERVTSFLNPDFDLGGLGYHQHQSLIAIGSGGFLGKGYGAGTQTQLSFLPEQQTDFIFSVWAEEHGFVGCAIVAALFLILILLCFRIATQAKDRFGRLLAVGVTAMIYWHAAINMLMVLRLAPVVGVPLPLWSNGGSFAITTLIGIGIVLNVGMRRYVF